MIFQLANMGAKRIYSEDLFFKKVFLYDQNEVIEATSDIYLVAKLLYNHKRTSVCKLRLGETRFSRPLFKIGV